MHGIIVLYTKQSCLIHSQNYNFFLQYTLLGATVSIPTTSFSLLEGDEGDTASVDVCIRLDDVQNGLQRQLEYTVDVDLGNAGFSL